MKKGATITIAIVTFIAGVMLGNQYGRRDVVNSRPPVIEGQLSQTASVTEQTETSKNITTFNVVISEPLFLFTDSGFVIYGAVSVAKNNDLMDAVVNIWKMPSGLSDTMAAGDFVLSLYDQNDREILQLKEFSLQDDTSTVVEASGLSVKAGQYLGIRAKSEQTPILISEEIK